jgi:hypothetical protein
MKEVKGNKRSKVCREFLSALLAIEKVFILYAREQKHRYFMGCHL